MPTETTTEKPWEREARLKRERPCNVELLAASVANLDAREGPRVGDFVRFACSTVRRISYHWRDDAGWDGGVQTSDTGSYHLAPSGYVSMSGSLFTCVPTESLTLTDETREGSVWIWDGGFAGAGRAVHYLVPFRVYDCARDAPTY